MMKPDWKDAPNWAEYLAMDEDGKWCWYEDKPKIGSKTWLNVELTRYKKAEERGDNWKESLEQR